MSIREQFDTATSMGRAMMNISATFAQLERETIAERIRDNMYQLARGSHWTGGTTPLGYKSEKETLSENGKTRSFYRLVIEPSEAAVVQIIFEHFLEKYSCKSVETYLILFFNLPIDSVYRKIRRFCEAAWRRSRRKSRTILIPSKPSALTYRFLYSAPIKSYTKNRV